MLLLAAELQIYLLREVKSIDSVHVYPKGIQTDIQDAGREPSWTNWPLGLFGDQVRKGRGIGLWTTFTKNVEATILVNF